mmetsp:Transcript_91234/g.257671  ORF Transcript_91234/g.257671 Transcript_91234/m.257671 type:complete len:603 (+) Transcript_91234:34-1842(+)
MLAQSGPGRLHLHSHPPAEPLQHPARNDACEDLARLEVELEAVYASGVDVTRLRPGNQRIVLRGPERKWAIGRLLQDELFTRLVPNDKLRSCISRSHFELAWDSLSNTLHLTRCTQDTLLVNGAPTSKQPALVAQGAHVGFCAPLSTTPFLVMSVLIRNPALESSVPPEFATPSPKGGGQGSQCTDSTTGYWLTCTFALGCDVAALPFEARSIAVPANAAITIGRQHQPRFFASLLGNVEQRYLTTVSRSHLELAPSSTKWGAFTLTSLCPNPVVVQGQQQLVKGDHTIVRPTTSIAFLFAGPQDNRASEFLRFSLSTGEAEDPQFWLDMGGTAVRNDWPLSLRRLPGGASGLTVGRAHQPDMHCSALASSDLHYVSREHFRIERAAKDWCLVALSGNPAWHVRGVERTALTRFEPLPLAAGDMVQVLAGATDDLPDGPGGQGTLHWTFYDAVRAADGLSARLMEDTSPVAHAAGWQQDADEACPAPSVAQLHPGVETPVSMASPMSPTSPVRSPPPKGEYFPSRLCTTSPKAPGEHGHFPWNFDSASAARFPTRVVKASLQPPPQRPGSKSSPRCHQSIDEQRTFPGVSRCVSVCTSSEYD